VHHLEVQQKCHQEQYFISLSKKASIDNGKFFVSLYCNILFSHTHPAVLVSTINDSTNNNQTQEVEDDDKEQGAEKEKESDNAKLSA
jgi:hypothetical protein